ncbi:MAG TPA: hypothetical protein VFH68_13310 [Polyangia bacterium]|nr:hypothetical protein [Polyangia bacterium]
MGGTPQRPAAVPDDAIWVGEAAEWRQGALDARGEKQGVHRTWRPDGTLREETAFVDGRAVGQYRRFHPNGQLAGQGQMIDGNLQGTLHAYASDGPTPERLQSCCVPPNAWELQSDYDQGQMMERRWYDRGGQQILDSGAPHPARPASVPREARYDEQGARWVVGSYDVSAGQRVCWKRWAAGGVLVEEEELLDSAHHGVWRRYDQADGRLLYEGHFRNGARHGTQRIASVVAESYQDTRAAVEEGQFEDDRAVGQWRLRDLAGEVIAERDLGVAAGEDVLAGSPALAPAGGSLAEAARELGERSRALRAERRPGEAIVACARAAALTGDAAPLRQLLGAVTWPRAVAAGQELAAAAVARAGDQLAPLVDALVQGGDPVALLRALASSLNSGYPAAKQLVDAALLLAPDHPGCLVTRALVNVHLGAPAAAESDARRLPDAWAEQRTHLLVYLRIIFPTFDFWPARTAVSTLFQEFPEAPAQPLPAIRAAIAKLATRLGLLRAALRRQLESNQPGALPGVIEASWLPPDLSRLLPDGPVELETRTFEQSFQPDEGDGAGSGDGEVAPEVETIAIDERPATGVDSIPGLLRLARRDWAALTWMCWSCGLDRVALPETLSPPATFGLAAGMSIERAWRCRDKLTSGGLVAMCKGVPGFTWEGIDIDEMPLALTDVMADEHVEIRAMFLWLCDDEAQSLWQGDLRSAD